MSFVRFIFKHARDGGKKNIYIPADLVFCYSNGSKLILMNTLFMAFRFKN